VNNVSAEGSGTNGDFHLMEQLGAYGCPEPIHLAGEPTAAHVEYLDLLPNRSSAPLLPEAVAEFQGRPVIYLLDAKAADEASGRDAVAVPNLQQLLANRSEQACLGIVRPGQLDVYPINLDRKQLAKAPPRVIQRSAPDAPTFFQSLAAGTVPLEGQPKEADSVFREIHRLLSKASSALVGRMNPLDVLSVTGRALFFRFLFDREIIREPERDEICHPAKDLKDCFSDAEKAAATSCWLDETFNGDLLPLGLDMPRDADQEDRRKAYIKLYRKLGADTQQEVFLHLQAIVRGWQSHGRSFQRRLDWDDFNFAHIPIGVLSQVYETFSRQWDGELAKKTSTYYTPKNIARCLVEEAFGGLEKPADARVLDSTCGAGIFLVLAFRKLVRARWEKDGQRPDTRAIQRILYNQICGFDVSESALRLAALALYVTAIELNGSTRPPKSLKFPLGLQEQQVLINVGRRAAKNQNGFVLGSLGAEVPDRFNGVFDVVIGNPPWTRLRADKKEKDEDKRMEQKRLKELAGEFTAISRRVLIARGLDDIAKDYTNPDNDPDLAFVWRAAEWAKPGGLIAMALPGRILLKQSHQGKGARTALIRGLKITGIINGSNLSDTNVWPKMNQPFMLFFARNAVSPPEHQFFVTHHWTEVDLAGSGGNLPVVT
jgi:type I restriction-modification system DNA methylase subunit